MRIAHPLILDRKAEALHQAMGPVIAGALSEHRVVEIMVNPDGRIWIDRIGEGRSDTGHSLTPDDAERILRLLADHAGVVVTRDQPRVSATLPITGERFQGEFMPIVAAPAFSIRKRPHVIYGLADYVEDGTLDPQHALALQASIQARNNLLIVGGTGSGKTTFANALLADPAFSSDRVVIIEDTAELQCSAIDKICMLTKRMEPAVSIADLVRDTLRLRPDRIIVGEVRDGSALDVLKAWNTGHPGGLATLHANSAMEGLTRLEELVAEVTAQIPHAAIARAINVVVFIRRTRTGRRVESVVRVTGWSQGVYEMHPL